MKKRSILKKLKQAAIKESLKHSDKGNVEIVKTLDKQYFIVRVTNNTSKSGILIDRLKGPYNTWTLKGKQNEGY